MEKHIIAIWVTFDLCNPFDLLEVKYNRNKPFLHKAVEIATYVFFFLKAFFHIFFNHVVSKYVLLQSGLPTVPNNPDNGPSRSPVTQLFPLTVSFVDETLKMDPRTIFVIALSAVVLLIVCCASISVFLKYKKICSSSDVVCPDFTYTSKRCGKHLPLMDFTN